MRRLLIASAVALLATGAASAERMNLDEFSIIRAEVADTGASLYIGSVAREQVLGVKFASLKLFCSDKEAIATISFGEEGISQFDLKDPMKAYAEVNGMKIDRLSIKRINENYITFYATMYERVLDIAQMLYDNHKTIELAIVDGVPIAGGEGPSALLSGPFRDEPIEQGGKFPLVEESAVRARIDGFYRACSKWWAS